jgi:hypothetical protein
MVEIRKPLKHGENDFLLACKLLVDGGLTNVLAPCDFFCGHSLHARFIQQVDCDDDNIVFSF